MTKERPILFSAPMVRAILEGRKTQTRRVVKPQPPSKDWLINVAHTGQDVGLWNDHGKWRMCGAVGVCREAMGRDWPKNHEWKCPYGSAGDGLWVRETWFCVTGEPGPATCNYKADFGDHRFAGYWKPSIHMPRWASRINLEITGVRVERLNEITVEDAIAEGIEKSEPTGAMFKDYRCGKFLAATPMYSFFSLWESINGPGSWAANPWVWVVEFRRVEQ